MASTIKLTLVAALFAVTGGVAQAATVQNGSFDEIGDFTGITDGDSNGQTLSELQAGIGGTWDVYSTLPGGWTTTSGGGIELQTKATLGVTPHSGPFYVELDSETYLGQNGQVQSNSSMEQLLGDLAPGHYQLSFWYRARNKQLNTNGVSVEIYNGALSEQLVVSNNTTSWVEYVFGFEVLDGSGPLTLKFSAAGNSDEYGGFIDTVSITAVPVPAPALLLLGALAGLGALRRTRS
ncbi:MAG: hypothetical protein AAF667_06265 [Pseudomonadota bacterium]